MPDTVPGEEQEETDRLLLATMKKLIARAEHERRVHPQASVPPGSVILIRKPQRSQRPHG